MLEILEEQTGQQQIREPGGLTNPIMCIPIGMAIPTAVRTMAAGSKGITVTDNGRIGLGTDQMLIRVIGPERLTEPAQETGQVRIPAQGQDPRIAPTIKGR